MLFAGFWEQVTFSPSLDCIFSWWDLKFRWFLLQSFALDFWCLAFYSLSRQLGEMDPAALIQSVQQAALAASQAAQALREASEKRGGGYAEANKVVQCPKEFGHATTMEDQSHWSD